MKLGKRSEKSTYVFEPFLIDVSVGWSTYDKHMANSGNGLQKLAKVSILSNDFENLNSFKIKLKFLNFLNQIILACFDLIVWGLSRLRANFEFSQLSALVRSTVILNNKNPPQIIHLFWFHDFFQANLSRYTVPLGDGLEKKKVTLWSVKPIFFSDIRST